MDPFSSNANPFFLHQQDLHWSLDPSQNFGQSSQSQQGQQQSSSPSPYSQSMPFVQFPPPFSAGQDPSMSIPEDLSHNIVPIDLISQSPCMLTAEQQSALSQQQRHLDENGQPIKIRKKPGRKPNPASPALRKAQNRAAQRAFRERKERHLRELENTIRSLREQRNNAVKELSSVKSKLDGYKAENWYLKGVVLTLQFVCLHHNIVIPNHSPYLSEDALNDIARTSPHAIEAYVNAYARNDIDLKPMMASQFANIAKDESVDPDEEKSERMRDDKESSVQDDFLSETSGGGFSMFYQDTVAPSTLRNNEDDAANTTDDSMIQEHDIKIESSLAGSSLPDCSMDETSVHENVSPSPSSLTAIQQIRLQLRVQSTLSRLGKSSVRLQPTLLQLAIPHDPRIDLIPTPHMRDRMIIFRDLMDYDRCFTMLLNGAVYHGGDPTMAESWELPAEFFSEFWYLTINYDFKYTNKWRLLKGLPELEIGPNEIHERHSPSTDQYLWGDEFSEHMPSLQPLPRQTRRSRSTSPDQAPSSPTHPFYESLRCPPESRNRIYSPSLDAMMELLNNMSTDS
ncbi:hypothetical protein BX666DRAFT_2030361 [Dichotomocladium elegans]|nr:hypothetical protein BX666DRAFT_2030361 [Dichotomocladium elegans]